MSDEGKTMNGRFVSKLGVIAIMGGLLGLVAAPASAQCLANEMQKLTASDASGGQHFGTSVRILGDLLVVGATNGGDVANSGAAYVFRLDQETGRWAEEQRITPLDAGVGDHFGISAAIDPTDPNVIIVGAYLDDDNGFNSGSAYVFRYNPDSQVWIQEQKLTAWDDGELDRFGWSVAIWGNVAMIGAVLDDDPEQDIGSVYVFGYDAPSGTWVQQQKLIPSDAGGRFGSSLSLQGDRALIGASTDSEQGFGAGAAYIFGYDAKTQTWVEQQKLLASDGGGAFGWWHIALDGDTALIGAYTADAPPLFGIGAAYVFRFDGREWIEEQKLTASDGGSGDQFAWSVALKGDLAVIGAQLDDEFANDSGSAYIFTRDGIEWNETAKLRYEEVQGVQTFGFGVSVSTDGEHAIVGGNGATVDGDAEAGAAYIYGGLGDCNENGELDLCDITDGTSTDDNNNGIPDECDAPPCPWDLDNNGSVGASDLLSLLAQWGTNPNGPPDFDGDGNVGASDLLALLVNWGPCP